tara:strand:+ start:191 stop:457 length:267 start_codon:yes stop_codon:yes gene_type:complete
MNKLTIKYRGQSIIMDTTKDNLKESVNKGSELLLGDSLEYADKHKLGSLTISDGNIYVRYMIGVLKEEMTVSYNGTLSAHELMLIFIG